MRSKDIILLLYDCFFYVKNAIWATWKFLLQYLEMPLEEIVALSHEQCGVQQSIAAPLLDERLTTPDLCELLICI